jgi:hypothetical protein
MGYFGSWFNAQLRPPPSADLHWNALLSGANTAAIVFWIVSPILFVTRVYKTEGVLDMERRLQLAE